MKKSLVLLASLFIPIILVYQNCGQFSSMRSSLSSTDSTPFVSFGEAADAAGTGFDIIIIAGQSNAVGYGCGAHADVSTNEDGRIMQVDPSGNIIQAADPLWFNPAHGNYVGFGMTFARLYAAQLPNNRKVLIVPTAVGATSLLQWDNVNELVPFNTTSPIPTDTNELWDRMVSRTQAALAYQGQQNRIVALLWHQGENDYSAIKATSGDFKNVQTFLPITSSYQARLQKFFELFRNNFAGGTRIPIVSGEIGSFWNDLQFPDPGSVVLNDFNRTIASATSAVGNSATTSSVGLISGAMANCANPGSTPDAYHFDAPSQVEFGKRYFTAFQNLSALSSSALTLQSLPQRMQGIQNGSIADGTAMSCDYFNPDAIKNLSNETIQWLGTLQASGLTLHETYTIGRQQGYTGAFGHGEHNLWLAQHPAQRAAFDAAIAAAANSPNAPYPTFAAHHVGERAKGYRGLWLCGGGSCFASGQCDAYGRRK